MKKLQIKKFSIFFISIFFICSFFIFSPVYADNQSDWNAYTSDNSHKLNFGTAPDYSYTVNSSNNTNRIGYLMYGEVLENLSGSGIPTEYQSLNNNGGYLIPSISALSNLEPIGVVFTSADNLQWQFMCYKSNGTSLEPSEGCYNGFSTTPPENSIVTTIPAEGANVNAYFTVSGTYTNDGTYTSIKFELFNDTDTSQPMILVNCMLASTGINLPFSCNYRGLINNSYHITPYMQNPLYSFPFGALIGVIPSIGFTTNANLDIPVIGGITCSTFDIGCYIVKGIQYLFLPDNIAVEQITDLIDTIKNKPPIGYITGTITALTSVSATATPTLSFASFTPLNDLVFTPVRTGLIWVLWIAFAFLLFKKFQNFQL